MDVFRRAPEASPRDVTPEVEAAAEAHGRYLRIFGGVWTRVGGALALGLGALALWVHWALAIGAGLAALIAVAGVVISAVGAKRRQAALDLYRDGAETVGEVLDVRLQRRTKLNGK